MFESLHGATKAVREMQNFNFYGKPMRVQFAKSRSDVVTKADGTYKPRQKRPLPPLPSKMNKAQKLDATTPMSVSSAAPITVPVAARAVEEAQPNQLLFLENLPEACTEEMLSMLFQQYDGFKEARTVKGRPGIAFVEFTDSYKSKLAKDALHDFQMTDNNKMKITFAK